MVELLGRFLGPYRAKALAGILTKMVEVVLEVLTPLVVARMIDVGVRTKDVGEVVRLGLVLVAFAAVSYSFTFICQRLAAQVSQGIGTDVRNALYGQINLLASAEVNRFGTPSLVTRVTNDVGQVQLAVALGIRTLTRWPLLAIGSMVAAVLIDLQLGVTFCVVIPAITIIFAFVIVRSMPYYRQMQAKLDRITLVTRETLEGMRVIRAFRQEDAEQTRSKQAVRDQSETAIAVGKLSSVLNPATFFIMYAAVGWILWSGGLRVNLGTLTTGQVIAFVSYLTQTLVSVSYMANLAVVIMRGHTSSLRILEVLDCEPSVTDEGNTPIGISKNNDVPALELCNVGFTYEGSAVPALNDVTLTLDAGSTLGIIGGTGSGKSTLVSLLPRLYDASSGTVKVFSRDVREYPLGQLRNVVSVVPQHVSLISGTVRSNLSWRDPRADDSNLWAALAVAQAEDFVRKLPDGLEAPVEAGGRNFSGGQRQRLTIARALVGGPRIVVLDDSASALDYATDARLRAALRAVHDEITCVIVSQRVASVMGADKILVLNHGNMEALGTHEELLRDCKLYQEICASQLRDTLEVTSHG